MIKIDFLLHTIILAVEHGREKYDNYLWRIYFENIIILRLYGIITAPIIRLGHDNNNIIIVRVYNNVYKDRVETSRA